MTPFDPEIPEPRRLRQVMGKGQREMAALADSPSYRTWQHWEANEGSMPIIKWQMVLIKCGAHPEFKLSSR